MDQIKSLSYKDALRMGPLKFVRNYLFPAMRRDKGNGFCMETWRSPFWKFRDDVSNRRAPACGTVACIGGTMQLVTGEADETKLGKLLGLSVVQTQALFFSWLPMDLSWSSERLGWPADLARKYARVKSAQAKERVAEEAVLRAVKTKGKCLEMEA